MNKLVKITGIWFLLMPCVSQALTIVGMNMNYDDAATDIFIEIYDEQAPVNAANFLGYVNRGDFDTSFFHRMASYNTGAPFVLQGGGFTYNPQIDFDGRFCASFGVTELVAAGDVVTGELGLRPIDEVYFVDADNDDVPDSTGASDGVVNITASCVVPGNIYRLNRSLQAIPVDTASLPVTGEQGISNVKGTLSMALTSAGGDSATNQWFINTNDNTQLDTQNDGFTVFGRVIGDGMNLIDTITSTASLVPIAETAINPSFGEIPVVNYAAFELIKDANLVKINTAEEILNLDISSVDFGYVASGMSAQAVITLTAGNQIVTPLDIDKVGDAEILSAPYNVTTDCEISSLGGGASCTITIDFQPVMNEVYNDVLDISFASPSMPNISIPVVGTSQLLPRVEAVDGNTVNFEYVSPGLSKDRVVTLQNKGQQTLVISSIDVDNMDDFSTVDDCTALNFEETCTVTVTFSPQSTGIKLANLIVQSNDLASPLNILLGGAGADSSSVLPDIDTQSSIVLGDTSNGTPLTGDIEISNIGGSELTITGISIGGADAAEFIQSNTCNSIAVDDSCIVTITFNPTSIGAKDAELVIQSDDPEDLSLAIPVIASHSDDADNIPNAEEDLSPNSGDGNSDGTPDSQQDNTVSFDVGSDGYLTLVGSFGSEFSGTRVIDISDTTGLPAGVKFDEGVFTFELGGLLGDDEIVAAILPQGVTVEKYYQYGATSDNTVPHWYEFMFDGTTGAQVTPDLLIGTGNTQIRRTLVAIQYRDGQRGDGDLLADGKINITGAFKIGSSAGSSSGSLSVLSLLFAVLSLLIGRVLTGSLRV